MIVLLELEVDEAPIKKAYEDYVTDWEWYRDNKPEQLDGASPSYAAEGPQSFESYRDDWIGGSIDDVTGYNSSGSYTIRRHDSTLAGLIAEETRLLLLPHFQTLEHLALGGDL